MSRGGGGDGSSIRAAGLNHFGHRRLGAYVCARIGRTFLPVRVRLLGGELVIDTRRDSMTMCGPAEYMRPFVLEWSAAEMLFTRFAHPAVVASGGWQ
jgi:hypothetical protein